jgi:hypothetical protein
VAARPEGGSPGRRSTARLERLVRAQLRVAEDEGTAALTRALRPARRRGFLTRRELEAVCRWKSARAIHHIRANTPAAVRAATRAALATPDETRRLAALTALRGVSVPMASALLTLLDPRRYGVLDIRVWQLLYGMGLVTSSPRGVGFGPDQWRQFLATIRPLAARLGVTARAVELTLFKVHRDRQEGRLYDREPARRRRVRSARRGPGRAARGPIA